MLKLKLVCITLTITLISLTGYGQDYEYIQGLGGNPVLFPTQVDVSRSSVSVDSNFIFQIDTLSLPIVDDFSTNKFKTFDKDVTIPGTIDTLLYRIFKSGIPDLDTVAYMFDTTYKFDVDTTGGTVVIVKTPLISSMVDTVNRNIWPLTFHNLEVWPAYNIYDTIGDVSTDTVYVVQPDLFQDTIRKYVIPGDGKATIWIDNYVFLNSTYPLNPPTVGVATFDGLDESGFPYDFSAPGTYGVADFLTSKPIDLTSPLDTVYLSFWYQPIGLAGDITVEEEDSLVVEFWSTVDSSWHWIWSTPQFGLTDFQVQMIPVSDAKYLTKGFQFRFKNYGNLSGSIDHWHVDYVILQENRKFDDTIPDDLAFTYNSQTLLKDYWSVPWPHYKNNPSSFMAPNTAVKIRNNDASDKILNNAEMYISFEGTQTDMFSIGGGNVLAGENKDLTFSVFDAPNNFQYDTTGKDTCATFEVKFSINTTTGNDTIRTNDTIRRSQIFENYYAYDDATAEAAWGIQSSTVNPQIALEYFVGIGDTLRAIDIYFNPSVKNTTDEVFILAIWDDLNADPIFENDNLSQVKISGGINNFQQYELEERVFVSGAYYVGIIQGSKESINFGLDRNTDNSQKLFWKTSGNFNQSGIPGSLMMRPVFISDKDYLLSAPSIDFEQKIEFSYYPNPVNQTLNLKFDKSDDYIVQMVDLNGRVVEEMSNYDDTFTIDCSYIPNGMYIVKITSINNGVSTNKKIVIKH